MKHKAAIIVAAFLILMGGQARAQDNWDKYQPRTLKEITTVLAAASLKNPDVRITNGRGDEIVMSAGGFPSQVKVLYTGSSRKVSERKKEVIIAWLRTYGKPPEYLSLFETEYLFTEDSIQYWLPVQKQVAAYFDKELHKGSPVNLYLVWIGARKEQGQAEHVFLVNEFEKQ